jgi:hypothetical protein
VLPPIAQGSKETLEDVTCHILCRDFNQNLTRASGLTPTLAAKAQVKQFFLF